MSRRLAMAVGVVLILIGAAVLTHPQFSYRVEQHSQQVGALKVLFETRKVIHFPLWFSVPILTIGTAFLITAIRKD
ncbi:MAG TPA: hypothetical protein VGU63_06555 [Candidatus Acidoferrales bacterium]|nr:hypothetical protein [Candidatus Acidoferrales bacterium]